MLFEKSQNDLEESQVYCNWEGFIWVWSFDEKRWLLDLNLSGGSPSPHEKSPSPPPYQITESVGEKLVRWAEKTKKRLDQQSENDRREYERAKNDFIDRWPHIRSLFLLVLLSILVTGLVYLICFLVVNWL